MDNELTDEDYGSMGVEDAAELAELKGLVHALAHPPPPPPAKQYDRKLAVPLIEATKEGDIEEMKGEIADVHQIVASMPVLQERSERHGKHPFQRAIRVKIDEKRGKRARSGS